MAAPIKKVQFAVTEVPTYSGVPALKLVDKTGMPIQEERPAGIEIEFTLPGAGQVEVRRFGLSECEDLAVVSVVVGYHFVQSGSHNSPTDYWNLNEGYEVHAHFVVAGVHSTLAHLATLVVLPSDKIQASGLNMPSEGEMIAQLKNRNIPAEISAIRALCLDGLTLNQARKALRGLRSPGQGSWISEGDVREI